MPWEITYAEFNVFLKAIETAVTNDNFGEYTSLYEFLLTACVEAALIIKNFRATPVCVRS